MSDIERRTIEELIARYELEPELKDIYVEGVFDRDVILACLNSSKESGLAVYEIDGVEVSAGLVFSQGFTDGNKQRVIVLSRELQRMLSCECSVLCLVDRDLDHWFQDLEVGKYLKWTRVCSIEACFLSESTIEAILVHFFGTKITDFKEYFKSLVETLAALYALRLADAELSLGMTWISFDKCLKKVGGRIVFDLDEYTKKLLINNSKSKKLSEFRLSYTKWKGELAGDSRLAFRGHDLVNLLAWSVKPFSGIKSLATSLSIERAMILLAGKSQEVISELQAEIS